MVSQRNVLHNFVVVVASSLTAFSARVCLCKLYCTCEYVDFGGCGQIEEEKVEENAFFRTRPSPITMKFSPRRSKRRMSKVQSSGIHVSCCLKSGWNN